VHSNNLNAPVLNVLMSVVNYDNMPVMHTCKLGTHWSHSMENIGYFCDCSWWRPLSAMQHICEYRLL